MDSKIEKDRNSKYLKKVQARSGTLTKGLKWYLLSKLFGLLPAEIAELEGLNKRTSSVRQLIIRVSDQLAAGEIKLIEYTNEESQAAKAALKRTMPSAEKGMQKIEAFEACLKEDKSCIGSNSKGILICQLML
jgi:hypothetical protein